MKGISGHFNECPHRHNTNVRTNNHTGVIPADSRFVLHLNSLTIFTMNAYIVFELNPLGKTPFLQEFPGVSLADFRGNNVRRALL